MDSSRARRSRSSSKLCSSNVARAAWASGAWWRCLKHQADDAGPLRDRRTADSDANRPSSPGNVSSERAINAVAAGADVARVHAIEQRRQEQPQVRIHYPRRVYSVVDRREHFRDEVDDPVHLVGEQRLQSSFARIFRSHLTGGMRRLISFDSYRRADPRRGRTIRCRWCRTAASTPCSAHRGRSAPARRAASGHASACSTSAMLKVHEKTTRVPSKSNRNRTSSSPAATIAARP